jgi:hypothetical protein
MTSPCPLNAAREPARTSSAQRYGSSPLRAGRIGSQRTADAAADYGSPLRGAADARGAFAAYLDRRSGRTRPTRDRRRGVMPTIPPKVPRDFLLAPVAAEIDLNLQRLRDLSMEDLRFELDLELDRPEIRKTREERAQRILQAALRNVETHNWAAEITDDGARLRLSGGSVSLDLGLSATILRYIEGSA